MYDDFKLCGEGDFLKIAKEYSAQQKAQILGLNNNEQNLKQDFVCVLNMAKNAYFALKQSNKQDISSILKVFKNNNLRLADEYKKMFNETFVPSVEKESIKNSENIGIKRTITMLIDFLNKFFNFIFDNNLNNLKENVGNYLSIIKEFLIKTQ